MSDTEVLLGIAFVVVLTAGALALALTEVVGWLANKFYQRHK